MMITPMISEKHFFSLQITLSLLYIVKILYKFLARYATYIFFYSLIIHLIKYYIVKAERIGSKSIYLEVVNLFMPMCTLYCISHCSVYQFRNCAQSTQCLIIQHVACICQFRVLTSNKYQFRTSQGSNL